MAPRKGTSRRRRGELRLERLEERQLLASILDGFGVEIATDIRTSTGTYDQVLLTGERVTVAADPGEIVRVAFLDPGGDIVQAEFGGRGTMTVSLEDVRRAGQTGYVNRNPTQVLDGRTLDYIQGLATITVDRPQSDTNLSVYAAGLVQNPGLFAGQSKQGDNGMADIARILLVGDPANAAGYSNMGGVRAGGAVFSAESGVVGIRGENVAVQQMVAIGDIDARGSAVPTLVFNSNSQFQTVFVRGGDLRQANGTSFDSFGAGAGGAPGGSPGLGTNVTLAGFSFFNSTDGSTSSGEKRWSTPVDATAIRLATVDQQTMMTGDWVFDWTDPQAVRVTQNGVDVSKAFGGDWLARGGFQASIDHAFERRTFAGNVTVRGDLPATVELNLADARADLTFENNLFGRFTVDGFGAGIDGTLTVRGNLDGTVLVRGLDRTGGFDGQQNRIAALVVEGNAGPFTDVRAEEIGRVTIVGSMSGIVSTDVDRDNVWTGRLPASGVGGYADYDGKIGDISVGYRLNGASSGGSIVNGTFQGMAGLGNVRVGGDIWGSPRNQAVFATASNPAVGAGERRAFGVADIGKLEVRGDIDLDRPDDRLIFIDGNGLYGDITVQGRTTSTTTFGAQIGTKTEFIPGQETFVRILSPFTDVGFRPDPAAGQKLVTNYDPDGAAGPRDDTYFVTAGDVAAGALVFDVASGRLVPAREGDRVPALRDGRPILDSFGNITYAQNTALFAGTARTVPVFAPNIVTIVSGNRGSLDGVANNFGRIEIDGVLGVPQGRTGSIFWNDSVDMNFGGVTVNSSAGGIIGAGGWLGPITIRNASGAGSDLTISGAIGSPNGVAAGANAGTAFVGLTGLAVDGFEDVLFRKVAVDPAANTLIHVTDIPQGIVVTTVDGYGEGLAAGFVSPSITFETRILLDDGTTESDQTVLLLLDTGMINSTVRFTADAGILVDDGATTGSGGYLAPLVLRADYVNFEGLIEAKAVLALILEGGSGIGSGDGTAISFTGRILTKELGNVSVAASSGKVVFDPRL